MKKAKWKSATIFQRFYNESIQGEDLFTQTVLCPWMPIVVLYCWCHGDGASVPLYFTFLSHLFPLPCGAGSTQVLLCHFPGVLWL